MVKANIFLSVLFLILLFTGAASAEQITLVANSTGVTGEGAKLISDTCCDTENQITAANKGTSTALSSTQRNSLSSNDSTTTEVYWFGSAAEDERINVNFTLGDVQSVNWIKVTVVLRANTADDGIRIGLWNYTTGLYQGVNTLSTSTSYQAFVYNVSSSTEKTAYIKTTDDTIQFSVVGWGYGDLYDAVYATYFEAVVDYNIAPTTPQISSPITNSISDNINITWNTSIDTDPITYNYQVSDKPDFSSIYNQSNVTTTYSGSIALSDNSPYYLRVRANDTYSNSAWSNTVTVYPEFVNLYAPANGTTESLASPMSSVAFTWSQRGSSYHVVIATDSTFTLNVTNAIVSTNYTSQYLSLGSSYWWKVQQYNPSTGTYYAWSNVSNFSVNSTLAGGASPDGTTGIQGVVYERKSTGNAPLSDVRVMLSNLTHFMETTTGSNGYFLFSGLANESDYVLQATKKNYDDSVAIPVQTINGTWVVQNVYMTPCTSSYTCNVNQQFVKFTVQTLFGTKFPNVEANVYLGSDATATYTDTTDAVGVVNFWLIRDQKYRLTFINSTQGINREMNIVASDTEYLVIISGTGTAWQQYTTQAKDAVFTNVTKSTINSTHAYINTSYLDTLEQTTALTVYINQTNASDPYNQTVIQSWTASAPMNDTSNSFVMSGYSGQQYLVHYVITHTTYGTVHASYSVSFTKDIIPDGVSSRLLLWFSIIFMVMTGAAFTASTAEVGLIIVAVEGWIFLAIGFLEDLNTTQVEVGLTIATVLGVISYIVMKNKREGYA